MKKPFTLLLFLILGPCVFGQVDHWERLVDAHDYWKYRLGNSAPDSNWTSLNFSDGNWSSGQGSIGYGDNDDSTTVSNVPSIYMRRSFSVQQVSDIEALVLHADFDDGFVAYLNGVEIARANVDTIHPKFNTPPASSRESTLHNGVNTWMGGRPAFWVIQDTIWKGLLQSGTNVLAVHTLDSSATWDLTTKYWLHCGMNTSTIAHRLPASWFDFDSFESPVAVMRINTYGTQINKNFDIRGELDIVWSDTSATNATWASTNNVKTYLTIGKRGRWSLFSYPKNGYGFETKSNSWTDTDISPAGMPEEEDWILHGPYGDRSMLRNVLAMHMARSTGRYASRTQLVELIINGQYEGVYVLMERIKRDKHRVDIAKLNPDEISGDDLTGGYIWKTDWEPVDWSSSFAMRVDPGMVPYTYVVPRRSVIVTQQETYIQDIVDDFEHALQNTSTTYNGKFWDDYIDLDSFVDYFLMQEVSKNTDAYKSSAFYHKDKDSKDPKIHAGPVWDFNFAFGTAEYCNSFLPEGWQYNGPCGTKSPKWWEYLVNTPKFADRVNCRWKELTTTVWHPDTLTAFIDYKANLLGPAAERDRLRWPLDSGAKPLGTKYVDSTYAADVARMKNFLLDRIAWLDSNMIGTDCQLSLAETPRVYPAISAYPNPSTGLFNVLLRGEFSQIIVRSPLGELLHSEALPLEDYSNQPLQIDLGWLPTGLYTIEALSASRQEVVKVIVAH